MAALYFQYWKKDELVVTISKEFTRNICGIKHGNITS